MAVGGVVSRSNVRLVLDFNRVFNLTCFLGVGNRNELRWSSRPHHCRHVTTTTKSVLESNVTSASQDTRVSHDVPTDKAETDVRVEYRNGLPQVTVPLPSRKELCRFTLRPITNTVGDFLSMIQHEDRGIDRVTVSTKDGVRIASSNTIESLMEEDFKLTLNDKVFHVQPPSREKASKEELKRLSDVRSLVNQLYEALNVEEHQLAKERELLGKLEELKVSLEPLEKKRQELEVISVRKTTVMTWVGLGMMSVQFGILARLTWWEYSWDIMEPVTYFVTYGTAMAAYAYFVLTKQEYLLPDVRDREHLLTLHKKARKIGLDLDQYNMLKDEIARTELDLSRLRDPLQIHLPARHISSLESKTPLERLKTLITRVRTK